jgi:hypothetical protein
LWCEGDAFDRIQVNALVRMVTAAARMVKVGVVPVSKKEPHIQGGVTASYASVFLSQHDRQHTADDGFPI